MHEDDRAVLEEWSEGRAGASTRLARRAWTILERDQRAHPGRLAHAVGGAGDAARWFKAFDAMGLAGLVDAPRLGRPASTLSAATQHVEAICRTRGVQRTEAARGLPRHERDALWRANRKTGANLSRRRVYDLGLAAPPGLTDLGGVFLGPGLCVLAAVHRADEVVTHSGGLWLDVPRLLPPPALISDRRPSVLTALGLRTQSQSRLARPPVVSAAEAASANSKAKRLLRRWVDLLGSLASEAHGRVRIHAVADLNHAPLLVDYFGLCRRSALWTPVNKRFPSALTRHSLGAHRGRSEGALQAALSDLFPEAYPEALREFLDQLMRPAQSPLAWVRSLEPQAKGDFLLDRFTKVEDAEEDLD